MGGFDVAALEYDADFTRGRIGKYQREQVWKQINKAIGKRQGLKILEINCGTGEDALFFTKLGHSVLATDISSEMIEVAKEKIGNLVSYKVCDFRDLSALEESSFDLVFSNFGGLNCVDLSDLKLTIDSITKKLNRNGRIIAVLMGRRTLWEILYFGFKNNFKEGFRRWKGYALANVKGAKIETWYYSPKEIQKISELLKLERKYPIGLFVPPSYLENYFRKHPSFLSVLQWLDATLAHFSWQCDLSDHYFIQFKKP